jgi:ankyrin repeat protein
MTIDELRVAVSIEADTECLDDESVVDEAAILLHCSSLVRRCEVPGAKTSYVEFSHFSVIEYLQGPFLQGTNLERYRVSHLEASRTLAIACLRTISIKALAFRLTTAREDIERADQRRQRCPFYTYAAFRWPPLAENHWEDDTISTLTNELFSPEKTNVFLSWIFEICLVYLRPSAISISPEDSEGDDDPRDEQVIQEFISSALGKSFTPLHVACALGLRPICQKLIESGADVNARCALSTPLYCATSHLVLLSPSYSKYSFNFLHRRVALDEHDEASGIGHAHPEEVGEEFSPHVEETAGWHRITFPSFLCHFEAQRPSIVQLLLDHGASPLNTPSSGGIMLFQAALWTSHKLKTMAMIRSLVEAGIVLNPSDVQQFEHATKRKWVLSDPAQAAQIMDDLGSFVAFLDEASSSSKAATHLYPLARDFMISLNRAGAASGDQKALPAVVQLIKDPFTTAVLAAQYNNDSELENILQQNKIDLGKRVNSKGQTILHIAVQNGSLESAGTLLRHGCNQSTPDFAGTLPVWLCSRDVCSGILRLMLENDPGQVTQRDNKGNTIWHMAAAHNSCETLRVLKDMSPDFQRDLKTRNLRGSNPLAVALHHLREDAAVLMVEYMPSLVSAWVGKTPVLHLAARLGSADLVQVLVDAGADATKRAADGSNPLHCLTQTCTVPCVQLVKSLYPDLYDRDHRRRRPLEAFAVEIGRISAFEWPISRALDLIQIFNELIPMDAIAVAPGPRGKTFWEEFCSALTFRDGDKERFRHMQNRTWLEAIVRRLMQIGAVEKHEEIRGTSAAAIMIASFIPKPSNSRVRWHWSFRTLVGVVQMLVEPEGATRYRDEALTSPSLVQYLHSMISSGALKAVQILVELGVNVRMKLYGHSALEVACRGSSGEIPAELLRVVLDASDASEINTVNNEIGGLAPIHLVGMPGGFGWRSEPHLEQSNAVARLQLLLEEGADPHLLTADGTSAVAFHVKNRATETATLLLDHGADPTHVDAKGFDATMHAVLRNRVEFLAYVLNKERDHTLTHAVDWDRRVNLVWDRVMQQRARRLRAEPGLDFPTGRFEGCSALHVAALLGHIKVLEFLLREGLVEDINAKAVGGWTALHFAAYTGFGDAIKILHRWGADLNVDASDGTCPEPLTPSAVVRGKDWARSAARALRSLRPQPDQQAVPSGGAERTDGAADAADEEAGEVSDSGSGSEGSSNAFNRSSGYNTSASEVSTGSVTSRRRRSFDGSSGLPLLPDVVLAEHMDPTRRYRHSPPPHRRLRRVSRSRDSSPDAPRFPVQVINIATRRTRMSSPGAPYTSSSSSSDSSDSSRPPRYFRFGSTESHIRKHRIERAISGSNLVKLQRVFSLHPSQMERPLNSCDVCTPLLFAIRNEKAEVVRWLIDQGAKLDAVPCHRHRPPVYRGKWLAFVPFMVASLRALNGVLDLVLSSYLALVGNPFSNGPSSAEGPWTLVGANPLHAAVLTSNYEAVPIIMKHIEQFKRTYK